MMKYIYTQRALRTICHTDCTEFTPVPVNIYQNYILKVIEWKWNHYIHGKMIPFHKENHFSVQHSFVYVIRYLLQTLVIEGYRLKTRLVLFCNNIDHINTILND